MKDKDIVYVADVPEFIKYVITARGLDPAKACVRIGMDAGAEWTTTFVNYLYTNIPRDKTVY